MWVPHFSPRGAALTSFFSQYQELLMSLEIVLLSIFKMSDDFTQFLINVHGIIILSKNRINEVTKIIYANESVYSLERNLQSKKKDQVQLNLIIVYTNCCLNGRNSVSISVHDFQVGFDQSALRAWRNPPINFVESCFFFFKNAAVCGAALKSGTYFSSDWSSLRFSCITSAIEGDTDDEDAQFDSFSRTWSNGVRTK